MTSLKKLQSQLSLIRNVKFNSPMRGNITNIISNCLFLGGLFTYFSTTSWYFLFNTDETHFFEYIESRFYVIIAIISLGMYAEIFRTRNDYNKFFEDLDLLVENSECGVDKNIQIISTLFTVIVMSILVFYFELFSILFPNYNF